MAVFQETETCRKVLALILACLLPSCPVCIQPSAIDTRISPTISPEPYVVLTHDAGALRPDAGCFVYFERSLDPPELESGAEAITEHFIGGWVNTRNTVLPALWFHDGGLAVLFDQPEIVSGRIWGFSGETGVGEALTRGQPLGAALFEPDGGMRIIGTGLSAGRSGTLMAVGGTSGFRPTIWQLTERGQYTHALSGRILGSDVMTRFAGSIDFSPGRSSPVLFEQDGGVFPLPADGRDGAARSANHSSVVGFVIGQGDIMPVRWVDAGIQSLPTRRPHGSALSVDGTGAMAGSEWTDNPNELPKGVAWSPAGIELDFEKGENPSLQLNASLNTGQIVGQCLVDGKTRGCMFRRSTSCPY